MHEKHRALGSFFFFAGGRPRDRILSKSDTRTHDVLFPTNVQIPSHATVAPQAWALGPKNSSRRRAFELGFWAKQTWHYSGTFLSDEPPPWAVPGGRGGGEDADSFDEEAERKNLDLQRPRHRHGTGFF